MEKNYKIHKTKISLKSYFQKTEPELIFWHLIMKAAPSTAVTSIIINYSLQ